MKQFTLSGTFEILVEGPFEDWRYDSEVGQEVHYEFWRAKLTKSDDPMTYEYGDSEEEAIGKVVITFARCSKIEDL